MGQVPIPASSEDLTEDWFRLLFSKESIERFLEVTVQRVGEGYGLRSEVYRCSLNCLPNSFSVIVKLWQFEDLMETREARFYREFPWATGSRIPMCFFAGWDEESKRAALVLEDFPDWRQGDCLQSIDLARAIRLTEEFATLHASRLNDPALQGLDWIPQAPIWRNATWFEGRFDRVVDRFGSQLGPEVLDCLSRWPTLMGLARDRLEPSSLNTLVHRDLHLDNLLFSPIGKSHVVLDWATISRGSLTLDLVSLCLSFAGAGNEHVILDNYIRELDLETYSSNVDAIRRELVGALLESIWRRTFGMVNWEPTTVREQALLNGALDEVVRGVRFLKELEPSVLG